MLGFIPRDRGRQRTYLILTLASAASVTLTDWLKPEAGWARLITIASGYLGLALIALTLLLGTWNLLKVKQHKNPVNIHLRRDLGIGAGVLGTVHVVFGLTVHRGGDLVQYFFARTPDGLRPLTDVFGFSNYVGSGATILLVLLLLLSNDLSMRWLRGPRWKWVQRLNYLLIAFTLAHTFGYQIEVQREAAMVWIVTGLMALTLVGQFAGIAISMGRRPPAPAVSEKPAPRETGPLVLAAALVIAAFGIGLSAVPFVLTRGEAVTSSAPAHEAVPTPPHEPLATPQHEQATP